ncbi:hydrogenase maturation protease [Actinophytocola sp. NPDC049390]|uniref:hydrogenase maturation protease n=1 Tax=Actinophytocola sp. NPDC049390 TaxID=3363894 RepID=UPI00379241BA
MNAVVIGVGNEYRRDDGIGPAVAARVADVRGPGVRVVITDGEPARLLDAWTGTDVTVVVDAVVVRDPSPGRVHRLTVDALPEGQAVPSSHGMGIPEAVELARALNRLPGRLVFYTVEIGDTGYGTGLSAPVAAAVGPVTAAVLRELSVSE